MSLLVSNVCVTVQFGSTDTTAVPAGLDASPSISHAAVWPLVCRQIRSDFRSPSRSRTCCTVQPDEPSMITALALMFSPSISQIAVSLVTELVQTMSARPSPFRSPTNSGTQFVPGPRMVLVALALGPVLTSPCISQIATEPSVWVQRMSEWKSPSKLPRASGDQAGEPL